MKNMKKILLLIGIALITSYANAQDDGKDMKNVRFGILVDPSLGWYNPTGKLLASNGIVPKIGGGLDIEFRLSKVASIATGVQIDVSGGKIKYNNGGQYIANANTVSYYYSNSDDKIITFNSSPGSTATAAQVASFYQSNTRYQLNARTYSITYITIPLTLKLKTKQIGMMTYYGQIGVDNSIRWKAKANDDVTNWVNLANTTNSKVDITKDVAPIHEALNIGLGTELNISGSTSLTFGLNYIFGFTNSVKSTSEYLMRQTENSGGTGYAQDGLPQNITSNSVVLTVGILF